MNEYNDFCHFLYSEPCWLGTGDADTLRAIEKKEHEKAANAAKGWAWVRQDVFGHTFTGEN